MLYFCADDYGISKESNERIEHCVTDGVLNKISVLPNGEITDLKQRLVGRDVMWSLHINLVEGKPLSEVKDISLLVSDKGCFKHSFIGLFLQSFSGKRKEMKKQLYTEIRNQVRFWKSVMGEDAPFAVDSHQHTHMIPIVFKTLLRVLEDEKVHVTYLRIPAEPLLPYILTPSLYLAYTPIGLVKQWLLKVMGLVNRGALKRSRLPFAYFMGVLFSGKMTEEKIKKLLPRYLKLAEKRKTDVELGFHPGYVKSDECLIQGSRDSFKEFYFSPWRVEEYNTLLNFKFE